MNTPRGVLCHHTAGPAAGDYPSERVVVNGRTGLPGPLCNLGLTRSGTWVVVAAGTAWHAGTGAASWVPANQGNTHLIGVEAESVGTRDDWTPQQRESYPRGVAALLRALEVGPERAIGHKEWAPGRKIDPAFWDMNSFRADVARWMNTITAVEDDLPTPADVWSHPIPDDYTSKQGDSVPAFAALGFVTARVTWALEQIQAVAGVVSRLETKVDRLQTGTAVTVGGLSDKDKDDIAARVVDMLAARLDQ
jgi:hypothetical protein